MKASTQPAAQVHVHIERIVLDAPLPADSSIHQLRAQLGRELGAALAEIEPARWRSAALASIDARSLHMSARGGLARGIAGALAGSLVAHCAGGHRESPQIAPGRTRE